MACSTHVEIPDGYESSFILKIRRVAANECIGDSLNQIIILSLVKNIVFCYKLLIAFGV